LCSRIRRGCFACFAAGSRWKRLVDTPGSIDRHGKAIMWYFSWILGLGFALAFGVLNAIWYEIGEREPLQQQRAAPE
jgi:cyd operon protein YbgT